jgi:hypothetical protein
MLPAIAIPTATTAITAITTATTAAIATAAIAAIAATATAAAVAAARGTRRTLFLETVTAIDRAIFARDKRNRRLFATSSADSLILLAAPATRALVG